MSGGPSHAPYTLSCRQRATKSAPLPASAMIFMQCMCNRRQPASSRSRGSQLQQAWEESDSYCNIVAAWPTGQWQRWAANQHSGTSQASGVEGVHRPT